MKLPSWRPGARGTCLIICMFGWLPQHAFAESVGVTSAVYVRSDTDETVVVSPRAHANVHLGEPTQVDVTYAADIWTSASIDIRASASRPVTEQRNELVGALSHDFGDLTLGASYRYSVENDYTSHGAAALSTLELAEKSSTLGLNLFGFWDDVGRSGDDSFSRPLTTLGARASFTQLIDPRMFAQLTYEIGHLQGYQASPYRWVGIGPTATGYGCVGAQDCFRENVPETRLRHALAALVRRALSNTVSIGAEYRFYFDDWEQSSHTVAAQLGWLVDTHALLTLRYRFYTQGAVWFYSKIYTGPVDLNTYITRDREQSPMQNHRVSLDFEERFDLRGKGGASLVVNVQAAGAFFAYNDFVGLEQVSALEVTLGVALEN